MIFLSDVLPQYCPMCGEPKAENLAWEEANYGPFFEGASISCACGAHFQYVPRVALLAAGKPWGDLHHYVGDEEA